MRFVSFNILSDDYVDFHDMKFLKRYYKNISANALRWKNREKQVINKLIELDADIYMLQEVMTEAREALVHYFADKYYIGDIAYHEFKLDEINFNRTGNLIMIRKSQCEDKPSFWSVPIGFGYNVAVAHFKLEYRTCYVLSIHLIDTSDKMKQVPKLLDMIDHGIQRPSDVILGGDFNTQSRYIHQKFEKRLKKGIQTDQADYHGGTYLCERPMIDYIYTTFPVYQTKIDNSPIAVQDCFIRTLKEMGSDHYPVIADL